MAFTNAELSSMANAALDYHFKGQPFAQTIQDKPLLALLDGNRKTFPGGKGDITIPVKFDYEFEATANRQTAFCGNLQRHLESQP